MSIDHLGVMGAQQTGNIIFGCHLACFHLNHMYRMWNIWGP